MSTEAVTMVAALALGWPLLRRLRRASRRGSNPAPLKPQPHGGREMLLRLEQLEKELRLAHMRIDQIVCRALDK